MYRQDATGNISLTSEEPTNGLPRVIGIWVCFDFTTDMWTSPNHKAYVAFTVHFEHEGDPMSMPVDLVGVTKSYSCINLVNAFAKVLEDFEIEDKVCQFFIKLNDH